ncbi:MAG: hypothetical protein IJK18_07210 [Clostridia bacterium]|nr:hypothetical protein [Clostridia bacterium]
MGDRRKGDRRAPEEGVIKIQKKNIWIYGLVIALLIFAIVLNIISWSAYFKSKSQYNTLVDHYYNGDTNNTRSTTETKKSVENNNYSCNISINGDKKSIKPGESIEYEVKISNINAGQGIRSFETYIDYDSNLFDCKVISNEEENWSKIGFLEGYLTMVKSDDVSTEDQVIAKIVFTAKSNVSAGSYKTSLNNIKFTSGDSQIFSIADNNINIKVD